VYVNEYLWQIIEAEEPLATMTSIIDLQGLHFSLMRQSDLVAFLKVFVKTMDMHYPQRANKTLVINAPKWFNVMYKLVSPLLRESTKAKIEIHGNGKRQDKALKARLGSEEAEKLLPKSFWNQHHKKKHHHHHHKHHHHHHHHRESHDKHDEGENQEEDVGEVDLDYHPTSEYEEGLREFVSGNHTPYVFVVVCIADS